MNLYDVHFYIEPEESFSIYVETYIKEDDIVSHMVQRGVIDEDTAKSNDYIEKIEFEEIDRAFIVVL